MRSSKAPELPVILLEDFGALIGLTVALLGVGLMLITGNPIFDVLGSGSIGGLLVLIAAFLAVEMNSLLVGESATTAHHKAILNALAAPEGIPYGVVTPCSSPTSTAARPTSPPSGRSLGNRAGTELRARSRAAHPLRVRRPGVPGRPGLFTDPEVTHRAYVPSGASRARPTTCPFPG